MAIRAEIQPLVLVFYCNSCAKYSARLLKPIDQTKDVYMKLSRQKKEGSVCIYCKSSDNLKDTAVMGRQECLDFLEEQNQSYHKLVGQFK